jgi:predicted permease
MKRQWRLLDIVRQDIRYAARQFARQPLFVATTIVVLALGVGANAAVFSVADRLFLRPPPGVRNPDQLKRIFATRRRTNGTDYFQVRFPFPEARRIDSALSLSVPSAIFVRRDAAVELDPRTTRTLSAVWVSPSYFSVLGARLLAGSDFAVDGTRPDAQANSAIISWSLWRQAFGGDRSVIGRSIRIDGRPITIRGVAPRGFAGIDVDASDIWLSLAGLADFRSTGTRPWQDDWGLIAFRVLARVPPGQPSEQLIPQIQDALRASAAAYSAENRGRGSRDAVVRVIPAPLHAALGPEPLSHRERIAAVLSGLALLLLVIAVANVGNLLVGRAIERQREIAVRTALGMDRVRLLSQVIVESLLLALAATIAAGLAAVWMGALLRRTLLPGVDLGPSLVDVRVATLAVVLGVVGGLAAMLIPLHSTLRVDLTRALKSGSGDGGGRRSHLRGLLVAVQAALCVVLLVGTGLLGRSLYNVRSLDLGLDVTHVITIKIPDGDAGGWLDDAARLARSLPGVSTVALATTPPLWDQLEARHVFTSRGDTVRATDAPIGFVGGDVNYLAAVGTKVILGRGFTNDDRRDAHAVMIVNEEMARRIWPGRVAVGQCLRIERVDSPCRIVVGVAENAHRFSVVEEPQPVFYIPLPNVASDAQAIVVRTAGATDAVAARLRSALSDTAHAVKGRRVVALSELLTPQLAPWQQGARLFAGLAALALTLAFFGLYGVLSYVVVRRRRELGVRFALGAGRANVAALIVGDGLRQIAIGAVAGILIALVGTRYLGSLLYHVSPRDPVVVIGAVLALLTGAMIVSLVPARRAMGIDPMHAMREE